MAASRFAIVAELADGIVAELGGVIVIVAEPAGGMTVVVAEPAGGVIATIAEPAGGMTVVVAKPAGGVIATVAEPGCMIVTIVGIFAAALVRKNLGFGRSLCSSSDIYSGLLADGPG